MLLIRLLLLKKAGSHVGSICTKYSELLATLIRPNNYLTQFDHYGLPAIMRSQSSRHHAIAIIPPSRESKTPVPLDPEGCRRLRPSDPALPPDLWTPDPSPRVWGRPGRNPRPQPNTELNGPRVPSPKDPIIAPMQTMQPQRLYETYKREDKQFNCLQYPWQSSKVGLYCIYEGDPPREGVA